MSRPQTLKVGARNKALRGWGLEPPAPASGAGCQRGLWSRHVGEFGFLTEWRLGLRSENQVETVAPFTV